jgi:hypothetical protein
LLPAFVNLVAPHLQINVYVQKELVDFFPTDLVAAHKIQEGVIDLNVKTLLQLGMGRASIGRLDQMTHGGSERALPREKDALMLPKSVCVELGYIGQSEEAGVQAPKAIRVILLHKRHPLIQYGLASISTVLYLG